MRSFIIYDFEFTSWEGALAEGWSRKGHLREIVQIGAIRVDCASLEVVAKLELLVKPIANPTISAYLTQLTGLTQDLLRDGAVEPSDALAEFLGFCRGQPALCYGNDSVVLGENFGWARSRGETISNSFLDEHFVNVKPWINFLSPVTKGVNSGRLWDVLDLSKPTEGQEHSAAFDCFSILSAIRHLRAVTGRTPESVTMASYSGLLTDELTAQDSMSARG